MRAINAETGEIVSIQDIDKESVIYDKELTDNEKIERGFSKFQKVTSGHCMNRWDFDQIYKIIEEEEC